MSNTQPEDVQAFRHALEASPGDRKVTLTLIRRSVQKVFDLLEAEYSTGAVVVLVKHHSTSTKTAELLGISKPTLMKLVDAGMIEHIRLGTHRRIPVRAIVKYQRQRQADHRESVAADGEFRSSILFGGDQ